MIKLKPEFSMQKGLLKTFPPCPPKISVGRVAKKKHVITHQYAVKASDFYVRVTYMLCFLGPKSQFFFNLKEAKECINCI